MEFGEEIKPVYEIEEENLDELNGILNDLPIKAELMKSAKPYTPELKIKMKNRRCNISCSYKLRWKGINKIVSSRYEVEFISNISSPGETHIRIIPKTSGRRLEEISIGLKIN